MADITALQTASDSLGAAVTKVQGDVANALTALQAHANEGPTQAQVDAITATLTTANTTLGQVSSDIEAALAANPAPTTPPAS